MSQRRDGLRLLVVLLVVASFAAPGLTYDAATPDRSHVMNDAQFSLLQGHEPTAVDRNAAGPNRSSRPPTERAKLEAGLRTIRADEVHRRGITGEGVQVGVIGSGFDPAHDAVAADVAGHRRVGRGRPTTASTAHDTAVAEVVTRTAPDADLYLAGVGTSPTPDEYAAALDWLLENEVDVVVDSGSYFTADGRTGSITAAAERAADRGVVFVTSAGNYADRHWSGEVGDGGANGWVSFAEGVEGNALADGAPTSGRVSIQLTWRGDADYDLYLYRVVGGRKQVVSKSVRRQAGNASLPSAESIDARVPEGRYYVAVHGHDGNEGDRLQLFSAHQTLNHTTASGSMVAPATSEEVIAVGAYDAKSGLIRRYSSRGVGARGTDVDVSAPDGYETDAAGKFRGTSAAAPYVAGTAALIESSGSDLSPAQVERILESTAREGGGVGRLDSMAAVQAVTGQAMTVGDAGGVPATEPEAGANASASTAGDGGDENRTARGV